MDRAAIFYAEGGENWVLTVIEPGGILGPVQRKTPCCKQGAGVRGDVLTIRSHPI